MTDSHPIPTHDNEATTAPQGEAKTYAPRQVNLKSSHRTGRATGLPTPAEYEQFPYSVSHAVLIGMDDDAAATVLDLSARIGIPLAHVQACLEATRERLSNLLLTLPPTVS